MTVLTRRRPPRLRIALVDTGYIPFPPPKTISWPSLHLMTALGTGLAARGHQVTFYAPKGSRLLNTLARIRTVNLPPLKARWRHVFGKQPPHPADEQVVRTLWDQRLMTPLFAAAARGGHDVVHVQNQYPALPLTHLSADVPVLFTLHSPVTPWQARLMELYAAPNQWYVSISDAQRRAAPRLRYLTTIYNGIDVRRFPFSGSPGSYLLFVGRIMPEKGTHVAMEVARRLRERLFIIGSIKDERYFATTVRPHLNARISYLGTFPPRRLAWYYRHAKALLFPALWEEAFGLVMVEAMACGTPVLAFRRGAVPEIVVNGGTGYLVDTPPQMVAAARRLSEIDRKACRAQVVRHFTLERMIDSYERAFLTLVERARRRRARA